MHTNSAKWKIVFSLGSRPIWRYGGGGLGLEVFGSEGARSASGEAAKMKTFESTKSIDQNRDFHYRNPIEF